MSQSMKQYVVKAPCGKENEFDDEDKAEEQKDAHSALCNSCEKGDVELIDTKEDESNQSESETDSKQPEIEVANDNIDVPDMPQDTGNGALERLGDELDTDPLSILPDHMKDEIQGTPAVNKRGYAMIAERYGIEVSADVVAFPWENDEKLCVASAKAVTEDGKEYSGWASASVEDGDMEDQLIELAETRALKRSVSWASGVGIVAHVELTNELE